MTIIEEGISNLTLEHSGEKDIPFSSGGELEGKANEFYTCCTEYLERLKLNKKKSDGSIISKRRIKPTLVASFGLSNNASPTSTFSRSSNTSASDSKSDVKGSITRKLWQELPITIQSTKATTNVNIQIQTVNDLHQIVKILKSSQMLLDSDADSAVVLDEKILLLLEWVKEFMINGKVLQILRKVATSQISILQGNHLCRLLNRDETEEEEEDWRRFSLSTHNNNKEGLDAVPVPYNGRRDSRNYSLNKQQREHANQQKIRDLLLDWIRFGWINNNTATCSNGNGSNSNSRSSLLPEGKRRVLEIVHQVEEGNHIWFADLLIREFEQLESVVNDNSDINVKLERMERMEKLEERFTKTTINQSKNTKSTDNAILHFIQSCDSHSLKLAVQGIVFDLIESIMQPVIDGSLARQEPRLSQSIIRLIILAKVLASVTSTIMGRYEDPVICFVKEKLLEAIEGGYLLLVLPWIYQWMRLSPVIALSAISGILANMGKGAKLLLPIQNSVSISLLLNACKELIPPQDYTDLDHLNTTINYKDDQDLSNNEVVMGRQKDLDEEDHLYGLERILLASIDDFKSFISALSLVNNTSNPTISTTVSVMTKPIRKVRPTLTNEDLPNSTTTTTTKEISGIQRKLRQWFWWQNPSLKDVFDTIIRHYHSESITIGASMVVDDMILGILPLHLRESPRIVKIVKALFLEQLNI